MNYGIGLPQVGRLADPDAVRAVATAADATGISSLWAMDRVLAPVHPRTPYPASPDGVLPVEQHTVLDPLGVLTLAASVTERVRIGTNVLVAPWYAPVLLARSLTTLDIISGGRLTVGLGLGWSIDEYEAVGVEQRGLAGAVEEVLDVLHAVWTDEVVEHHGRRYRIAPSTIDPKPVPASGPPVLLAAYTPAGLDRVARRADGWTPAGLPVAAIAPMFTQVRDAAATYGRDPDALQLVVRANIKVTDRPLDGSRPSYCGSTDQIISDLVDTQETGAHEVILDAQGSASTALEYLELINALVTPAALAA
jgi:probable F420-dependent oxidoreductase